LDETVGLTFSDDEAINPGQVRELITIGISDFISGIILNKGGDSKQAFLSLSANPLTNLFVSD